MMVASVEGCNEFDLLVTTTPAPPPHANAWRQVAATSRVADCSANIMLIGDSMAAAFAKAAAARAFPGASIVNRGVNGFRTQHVLWMLNRPEVLQLRPAHIVLMIGTNNLSAGDKAFAIAAGIAAIIRRMREIWAEAGVILIQTVPRAPGHEFREADRQRLHLHMIQLVGGLAGVEIVDADAVLLSDVKAYCPDHMHLAPFGYDLIAALLGG